MNKEQLKIQAKEFCDSEGNLFSKEAQEELVKFAQHLLDTGKMVDRLTYDQQCQVSKSRREQLEALNTTQSGEVKSLQELRDKIAVDEYGKEDFEDLFWSWSDAEGNDGYDGITAIYDKAAEMYADQLKHPSYDLLLASYDNLKEQNNKLALEINRLMSGQKELLKSAFEAGEEYANECTCGKCSYCLEFKDEYAADFEQWHKEHSLKSHPVSTEISEEKISDIFFEIAIIQDEYGNSVIRYEDFVKWYRDQLNKQS